MFIANSRCFLIAMAVSWALESAAASGQQLPVIERWGVLVGIDEYANAAKLRYCGADQRGLRDQLVAAGFMANQIVALDDQTKDVAYRPTKANIERQWGLVDAQVALGDFLVVGLSGHGVRHDGKSYFCPVDGRLDDPTTLISLDWFFDRLQANPASVKLVVLDICRTDPRRDAPPSTKSTDDTRALAQDLKDRKLPRGVYLLNSCSPGEVSWDDSEAKHSVFVDFLLKGLRGTAEVRKDGIVSLAELQSFTSTRTKAHVLQQYKVLQRPFYRSSLNETVQKAPLVKVFASVPPVVVSVPLREPKPESLIPQGPPVPASLVGRINPELKKRLLQEQGGTERTEQAVERGLNWLVAHQLPNGMWSLTGADVHKTAAYPDGSSHENYEAATAMALLAFLGSGHSPSSGGAYGSAAAKGVEALMRSQDKKGSFFRGERADDWLYSQGLCTLAMCECLGLEPNDDRLKLSCERAVQFCIGAQSELGGWRYVPRRDSDTSVTGWMVMALNSAKNAGIDVPAKTWKGISAYLDSAAIGLVTDQPKGEAQLPLGSLYSYQPGMDHDPVMTAEALLCRIHLGWPQNDARLHLGCNWILTVWLPEPTDRDVYYWYYATQTMFHVQGDCWKKWNGMLRERLVTSQEQGGSNAGSWYPLGKGPEKDVGADYWSFNNMGGRHYVTCFSLCILQTYYRNLPYYSDLKKLEEVKARRIRL